MKTIMMKAAALTALAALVPASLALCANAQDIKAAEETNAIVTESGDTTDPTDFDEEDMDANAPVTISDTTVIQSDDDDETEQTNTACYIYSDDDGTEEEVSVNLDDEQPEGFSFLLGSDDADFESGNFDQPEGDCTLLSLEEANARAEEKLSEADLARWQELTAALQESDFINGTQDEAVINELIALLNQLTDADVKWNGITYTCKADPENAETFGVSIISDGEDDGIVNEETSYLTYTESSEE